MADFEDAVDYVLKNEGGLVNNPQDPGGINNFGISLRFLRSVDVVALKKYGIFEPINADTVRDLVRDQAKLIYKHEYWERARFEEISNQIVCNYIFDMCVNVGLVTGIKIVQRALCAKNLDQYCVRDDGILGNMTLAALNAEKFNILPAIVAVRAEYYRHLVDVNPRNKEFLNGWLNRCYI